MSSNYWLVQIKYNNFNTSMIMKIAFNKEIHLYKGEKTMKSLKNYCEKVFKHLPFAYDFYYID